MEEAGVAWDEGQQDHESTGYVWGLRHSGPECKSSSPGVRAAGAPVSLPTRWNHAFKTGMP